MRIELRDAELLEMRAEGVYVNGHRAAGLLHLDDGSVLLEVTLRGPRLFTDREAAVAQVMRETPSTDDEEERRQNRLALADMDMDR